MSFDITIESSGHRFPVERGETLLEAALAHGIGLPYGCRNGSCGSCMATLLSGRVHYPDGPPPALEGQAEDQVIVCQALADSDVLLRVREVELEQDIVVKTLPCRAEHMERLSEDVMLVQLRLPEAERLQFLAGQYIEFILKDGRRRAFSIANAPHRDDFLELHIRHVPGGSFTGHVFEEMQDRALLRIEGPLGSFYLRERSARPILMMAGGTGFAPLKGMLEHAFHIGLENPLHLFWGARSEPDLYLDELPRRWQQEHANFRYTPVLSEPGPDWQGASGPVDEALLAEYPDLAGFDIYMSGPPAMIESATPRFADHGAQLEHMYSDAFEFASDVLEKMGHTGA
ncbi:MAG TPA: CDP-6-deoxy-delta-3,4-glucoseen reductase [Gammaproteobacteria bacterium]|nr:CDP-6-deoxy-delta-3,4-glucoseen reductase [Gammaproteobacteria bacterium]